MAEMTARPPTRLAPANAWTVVTDAPLRGLVLAREAGRILAWDETDTLTLHDADGSTRATARAPGRIIAAAIADDGSMAALIGDGARLIILDANLATVVDRSTLTDPATLAIDPHGRYVAVASKLNINQLSNRHGKPAGRFETRQPLAHLGFVADRPLMLGAAAYGTLAGIDLEGKGGKAGLAPEVAWQENLMSNVGRLAWSGDGGMVLAACFTHGIQRFDLQGRVEGSYHLGGSASHAVPDFAGRSIAVATLEGEIALLGPGGEVRWSTGIAKPAIGLEFDPLGKYLIYGLASGEIRRVDLFPTDTDSARTRAKPKVSAAVDGRTPAAGGPGPVREPDWSIPAFDSDDQAAFAVLAVLDEPPRVAMITTTNRFELFDEAGNSLGHAPEVSGVGRIIRTAPGWVAAATDRNIALGDLRRDSARRLDLNLVEVTHLAIAPDTFGLAIVQERDRVGRATAAGRWVWRREQKVPVEDLAIGPDGFAAVTLDDGHLIIFDPSGEIAGSFAPEPAEPLGLIEAPDASPPTVAWLTLARRAQILRGHDRSGRVAWQSPVPWEAWQFQRVGSHALLIAPDGRTLAYDGTGRPRAQGRAADLAGAIHRPEIGGGVGRVERRGVHLIATDLAGQIRWRAIVTEPIGPIAAGRTGVAAVIGRRIAYFADRGRTGEKRLGQTNDLAG